MLLTELGETLPESFKVLGDNQVNVLINVRLVKLSTRLLQLLRLQQVQVIESRAAGPGNRNRLAEGHGLLRDGGTTD